MSKEDKNDVFYVCSLIEYIARVTKNRICDIVKILGKNELKRQLELAEVNHTLSFEQVSDEIIEEFDIKEGDYDFIGKCIYEVPSYLSIGKNYQRLIEDVCNGTNDLVEDFYNVMTSFITDEMSNYNSSFFYSSREYLKLCYKSGKILE